MNVPVLRHRALFGDELIGHVISAGSGWTATGAAAAPDVSYASAAEAEAALREEDDRARSVRIVAASFMAFLVAHPVLFILSELL